METDSEDPRWLEYKIEGPAADMVCPACASTGEFEITSDTRIKMRAITDGLACATLASWSWHEDSICKCDSCGLIARVGLFTGKRTAWMYSPGDTQVVEVQIDIEQFLTSSHEVKLVVDLPDEYSERGASGIAVNPIVLHTNKAGALEDARTHLDILRTLAASLEQDVATRLAEVEHVIAATGNTSSEHDATTEG